MITDYHDGSLRIFIPLHRRPAVKGSLSTTLVGPLQHGVDRSVHTEIQWRKVLKLKYYRSNTQGYPKTEYENEGI